PGWLPKSDEKITLLPSMDHCGAPRTRACSEVTRVTSPPDLETDMISSGMPDSGLRTKRIACPSGENEGPQSSAIGAAWVIRFTERLSSDKSAIPLPALKAIDFPSGAQANSHRFGKRPGVSNRRSLPARRAFRVWPL